MSPLGTTARFASRAKDQEHREILTPEGVPLVFAISRVGDRALAFLIDVAFIAAAIALLSLLALFAFPAGQGWVFAFFMLGVFLLRNFYFIWFELRWQGRTPGKRIMGTRVIDARGSMLSAEAICVRNLTREAEVFIPIMVLSDPELLTTEGPGWVRALAVVWLAILALMPLFNRHRMRVGDLLAGTLVVDAPKGELRRDLARSRADADRSEIRFTPAQLDLYGIYELQVLEVLLREEGANREALEVVAGKIRNKISWDAEEREVGAKEFLTAFYRAQRARLESDLLRGTAREQKRRGRLEDG